LARLVVQGKYFSHTGALSTICADGTVRHHQIREQQSVEKLIEEATNH
jgi:hypothetical protein